MDLSAFHVTTVLFMMSMYPTNDIASTTTTNGVTQTTTSYAPTTPKPDEPVPVTIAVLGAVCGFQLAVIIAGAVVFCRRKIKSKDRLVLNDTGTREMGRLVHRKLKQDGEYTEGHSNLGSDLSVENLETAGGPFAAPNPNSTLKSTSADLYAKVLPRRSRVADNERADNQADIHLKYDMTRDQITNCTKHESSHERNGDNIKNFFTESARAESNCANKCSASDNVTCAPPLQTTSEVMTSSGIVHCKGKASNGSYEDIVINTISCGYSSIPVDHYGSSNSSVETSQTNMNLYDFPDGTLRPLRYQISDGNASDEPSQHVRNVCSRKAGSENDQQDETKEADVFVQTSRLSRGYTVEMQNVRPSQWKENSLYCSDESEDRRAHRGSDGSYAIIENAKLCVSSHSDGTDPLPGHSIYEDITVVHKPD